MVQTNIAQVPANVAELGFAPKRFMYKGHQFDIELVSLPMTATTNDRAKRAVALNMEANIRKSQKGLGLGQYMSPEETLSLRSGEVILKASVSGKSYKVPIVVSPEGGLSTTVLRGKYESLRDVVRSVMDAMFEYHNIRDPEAVAIKNANRVPLTPHRLSGDPGSVVAIRPTQWNSATHATAPRVM